MKLKIYFAGLFLLLCAGARAQYYEQGVAPASVRWRTVKTPQVKLIYQTGQDSLAGRMLHYLDTIRPWIGHGFRYSTFKMPVIMSGQNLYSNGLVMWAPKRMELMSAPEIEPTSAEPWLKQLATHEYRHNVQYNNLNRGIMRPLGYVIGQQSQLISLALMPLWALEGDAVVAETAMSKFGRGVQPSFSIEYRALLAEQPARAFVRDKWIGGSYRDNIPDHYKFGYQMTSWAWEHYGENPWDKVSWYASRNPYMIFTTYFGLHKFYKSSVRQLVDSAFTDLKTYWDKLPQREDSGRIIPTPVTSYTTYKWPMVQQDGSILALKSDFDKYNRFVKVDPKTGREKKLFYTGDPSTRPVLLENKLYWTEYRYSAVWGQRTNSRLMGYDLETGRRINVKTSAPRLTLYPTPVSGGEVAWVEYRYDGSYAIHSSLHDREPIAVFGSETTLHGLAYDDMTGGLFFTAIGEEGMWIGKVTKQGVKTVLPPGYATLSNLRAGGGKLWFGSIASGYDEAHMIDLRSGKEYRVSTSKYGSFSPIGAGAAGTGVGSAGGLGDSVVMTTYTRKGYLLSVQAAEKTERIEAGSMPENIVNPQRGLLESFRLPKIDTIRVEPEYPAPSKRYRRVPNMFNIHSWAPLSYHPESLIDDEGRPNVYAGFTLISQSLLNTSEARLNYSWTDYGSMVEAAVSYMGLAPKFEVEAQWGGGDQVFTDASFSLPQPKLDKYKTIKGKVYLPLLLSSGYHFRLLQAQVDLSTDNSLLYNRQGEKIPLYKATAQVYFGDNVRMAYRDMVPRWAYAVRGVYATNPFSDDFGQIFSAYASVNTPGIFSHNALTLATTYQYQKRALFNFRQKELYPRGADYNNVVCREYWATSANYYLPLFYPDGGFDGWIYFRRIALKPGFDYAKFKPVGQYIINANRWTNPGWQEVWSVGGEILLDFTVLRTTAAQATTMGLTLFRPSDTKKWVIGVNFTLPI